MRAPFVVVVLLMLCACDRDRPQAAATTAPSVSAAPPASSSAEIATAPSASASTTATTRCREQAAQSFLVRGNYIAPWNASNDERNAKAKVHQQAIEYRTKTYGFYPGFGRPEWNAHPPTFYVKTTTFFGLEVKMHEKVIPALACVEEALRAECADTGYQPKQLAGIRYENTFQGGEVTNHIYGIAIDVDPTLNTCCGCVPPWSNDARCFKKVDSIYGRMAMPECWVKTFERYGFYWLGHDTLQDTMHFDFAGDPDAVLEKE